MSPTARQFWFYLLLSKGNKKIITNIDKTVKNLLNTDGLCFFITATRRIPMDKTQNKFITYLKMFFLGVFFGITIGAIIIFVFVDSDKTVFWTIMKVLFAVILYKLFAKFNFDLCFGISVSIGLGLVLNLFLKKNNITEIFMMFLMTSSMFMMNYVILKLINYTFKTSLNKTKEKLKK